MTEASMVEMDVADATSMASEEEVALSTEEAVLSGEAEIEGARPDPPLADEGLRQRLQDKERLVEDSTRRVVALEEEVERQEAESRRLREERDQLGGKLAGVQAQAQEALARYREKLLTSAPEVPPELVKGDTVVEVEASLAAAQDLVERVRRQLLAQSAAQRVPSGVPTRRGLDLSTLSPAEKIALGLKDR